jgi:FdhD protein
MQASIASPTRSFTVRRITGSKVEHVLDAVAAEEPLEVRVSYSFKDARMVESMAVTMRTPGNDRELAAGFLHAERVLRSREEVIGIRTLGTEPSNEIQVELSATVEVEAWRMARKSFVNSSCGICGRRSLDALGELSPAVVTDDFAVSAKSIQAMPRLLRDHQAGFEKSGGLHAAALINENGIVEDVFEDIGRHNALDKLIGSRLLNGDIPLHRRTLFLSSRSSFELVEKAALAGAPILATVGAPSSLAIEAARKCGLTLIGFVREGRANVYAGDWRIHSE